MRLSLPITSPVHASPTRAENEKIWTRVWVCAGLEQQVAATGDLLPVTVGDYGLHLRREADGGIRAAFNLLQHGSCWTIPEQCRSGHKTSCPYTACAYSRDSDTVSAQAGRPVDAMRQFIGFNPLKLHTVPVAKAGPLIFLSLAGDDAPGVGTQCGGLATVVDDLGLTCSRYVGRFWTDLDCHWSIAGDALLHEFGADDRGGMVTNVPLPAGLAQAVGAHDSSRAQVWRWFPNLVLVGAPGHVAVVVVKPIGFTAVSAVVSLFTSDADADVPGRAASLLEAWRALMGSVRSHATRPGLDSGSAMTAMVARYLTEDSP